MQLCVDFWRKVCYDSYRPGEIDAPGRIFKKWKSKNEEK